MFFLQIPLDPSTTSYTLAVIGCGENSLTFSRRIQVKMQTKSSSIFIQTDKATYKRGERVRIQVISVNHDLRPHKGDVDLIIKVCLIVFVYKQTYHTNYGSLVESVGMLLLFSEDDFQGLSQLNNPFPCILLGHMAVIE